jgi:cell division septum initiation protein DivIVA
MATAPEELQPQPGEENEDPNAQPPDDGGDPPPSDDDPYAPLAQKMGWVPKDQFRGPAEKWKPAEQFIIDGHSIQQQTSKELREMRQTLDAVSRTSASIVEQQIADKKRELERLHAEAVEEGDVEGARKISQRIDTLQAPTVQPVSGLDDWKRQNRWFESDPLATARAFEISDRLAAAGVPKDRQLAEIERGIRKEFPELFNDKPQQRPPSVSQPGSRTSAPSNRARGFHDMPKAAQDVAKDMLDRGVIPNLEAYTNNYWKSAGGQR